MLIILPFLLVWSTNDEKLIVTLILKIRDNNPDIDVLLRVMVKFDPSNVHYVCFQLIVNKDMNVTTMRNALYGEV